MGARDRALAGHGVRDRERLRFGERGQFLCGAARMHPAARETRGRFASLSSAAAAWSDSAQGRDRNDGAPCSSGRR